MSTTKASLEFIAVHLDIKKRYASNYPEVIKPYIKILRQIMDSNHISVQEALKNINNSTLVRAKQVKDLKKQDKENAIAFLSQRLYVSALLCILEADAITTDI
jgi:hypothetical protein